MLKRECKVYIQVVKNCSVSDLMSIIEEYASKDSVIFTDGFKIMMVWLIMATSNIIVLIIAKSFPKVVITLMVLRTFGA